MKLQYKASTFWIDATPSQTANLLSAAAAHREQGAEFVSAALAAGKTVQCGQEWDAQIRDADAQKPLPPIAWNGGRATAGRDDYT